MPSISQVPTLADLRKLPVPADGALAWVDRHGPMPENVNDDRLCGGGLYRYDANWVDLNIFTAVFPNSDDDGSIIKPDATLPSAGGRWVRVESETGPLNVRWFGALGERQGADDSRAIQRAVFSADQRINHNYRYYNPGVYIPAGEYRIESTVAVPYSADIKGDNAVLFGIGDIDIFQVAIAGTKLEGLTFQDARHHIKINGLTGLNNIPYYRAFNSEYLGNEPCVIDKCRFQYASGPAIYQDCYAPLTSDLARTSGATTITFPGVHKFFSGWTVYVDSTDTHLVTGNYTVVAAAPTTIDLGINTASASRASNVVTIVFAQNHWFAPGDSLHLVTSSPDVPAGDYTLTAVTPNTVSFALSGSDLAPIPITGYATGGQDLPALGKSVGRMSVPTVYRSFQAPLLVSNFRCQTASLFWGCGDDVRFELGEVDGTVYDYTHCIMSDGFMTGMFNSSGVTTVSDMRLQLGYIPRYGVLADGTASGQLTIDDSGNFSKDHLIGVRTAIQSQTAKAIYGLLASYDPSTKIAVYNDPGTGAPLDLSSFKAADNTNVSVAARGMWNTVGGYVLMHQTVAGDTTGLPVVKNRRMFPKDWDQFGLPYDVLGPPFIVLSMSSLTTPINAYWYQEHEALPGQIQLDQTFLTGSEGYARGIWLSSSIDLSNLYKTNILGTRAFYFTGTFPQAGYVFGTTSTDAGVEVQVFNNTDPSYTDLTDWFHPFIIRDPDHPRTESSSPSNNLSLPGVFNADSPGCSAFLIGWTRDGIDDSLGYPLTRWQATKDGAYGSIGLLKWGSGLRAGVYTLSFYFESSWSGLLLKYAGISGSDPVLLGQIPIAAGDGFQRKWFSFYYPGGSAQMDLAIAMYPPVKTGDTWSAGLFAIHSGVTPGPYTFPVDNAVNPTTNTTLPLLYARYIGDAAPVGGTYVTGDMVVNSAPTVANIGGLPCVLHGWECVSGGTPGAWSNLYLPSAGPTEVVVTTPTYAVGADFSYFIFCNQAAGVAITLPGAPTDGQSILVKDVSGNAGVNNITVNGNGVNIDGSPAIAINQNYQSRRLIFIAALGSWAVVG